MSYPAMTAVPLDMVMSPVRMLKVVVLPAPLTPSSPKHSALGMATLIPPTANFDGRIEQPSTELEYSLARFLMIMTSSSVVAPLTTLFLSADTSESWMGDRECGGARINEIHNGHEATEIEGCTWDKDAILRG